MDVWERQDAMSADTPNAFTQAKLNRKHGQARVIMKIAGVLVELLMKKAPHIHEGSTMMEHRKKVTHSNVLKEIHGMLESASLWYQKF